MKRGVSGKFLTHWDGEPKQRVNLSLTESAWEALGKMAEAQQTSRSELVEQFARQQFAGADVQPSDVHPSKAPDLSSSHSLSPSHPTVPHPSPPLSPHSELLYRSVIESAAEGIVLQYADGKIFTCNPSAERILGLTAAQMAGRTSLDPEWRSVHEDGSPFPGETHPAMVTLRTGQPQSNVVMGVHKPNGHFTWISINTRPLFEPGETQPYAVVASFFDITEQKEAEKALRTSEERFRSLSACSPVGIFLTDTTGNCIYTNPRCQEICGFTFVESLGTGWSNFVHPEDRDRVTQAWLEHIRQGRAYSDEFRFQTPQGSRLVHIRTAPMLSDRGELIGHVGTAEDMTERQKAEAERAQLIREQVARLEAETAEKRAIFLAEASAILASSLNYETTLKSVLNLVLPFFADLCLIYKLEKTGEIYPLLGAHHDPTKREWVKELTEHYRAHLYKPNSLGAQVLHTGKPILLQKASDSLAANLIEDARLLELYQQLSPQSCLFVPLSSRGQILGLLVLATTTLKHRYSKADLALAEELGRRVAIAIDNAHLYHAAQQAKEAAEQYATRITRLQSITSALSRSLTRQQVATVIVEQGAAALGADAALVALLTPSGTELEIAHTVGYHTDRMEAWRRFPLEAAVPLADAVRTGQPIWETSTEERVRRYPHLKDAYASYDFQAWISLPLMIDGQALGGFSFSFKQCPKLDPEDRDWILAIAQQSAQALERVRLYEAERTARSEAEAANRFKDQFLSIVSHELRTPLNAILGWSQLLRTRTFEPATVERALETIERNARSQKQLIEDLLDISRIIRGKVKLNLRPINLSTVIEAALESVQLSTQDKALQIQLQVDPRMEQIQGDAERLQQVIWNLLSNAVKFTPAGGAIVVKLEETTTPSGSREVHIVVSDTGQGISPEFLPHVFEHFRQADGTTTRTHGGLGLGLAIVRHLVTMHGGTVEVTSPGEGQGSTFTVKLPQQASRRPDRRVLSHSLRSQPDASTIRLEGLRVLVVEDQEDNREFLAFVLHQYGASALAVDSAAAALQTLQTQTFDVLVSDIGMPEQDGYSLIRQIRMLPPQQGGKIPAIALTAYAREEDRLQAIAAGFQMHVTKPIDAYQLVTVVAKLINSA